MHAAIQFLSHVYSSMAGSSPKWWPRSRRQPSMLESEADFQRQPLSYILRVVAAEELGAQSPPRHAQQGDEDEQHKQHGDQDGGQPGGGFEHAQRFLNVGVGRVFQLLAEEQI